MSSIHATDEDEIVDISVQIEKDLYTADEIPSLEIERDLSLLTKIKREIIGTLGEDPITDEIEVVVTDPTGKQVSDIIEEKDFDTLQFIADTGNDLVPGEYTITVKKDDQVLEDRFMWGVLAMNANKSSYTVGETAVVDIGVLDSKGQIICDAELALTISTPSGESYTFTTLGHQIVRNEVCGTTEFTLIPDYQTEIQLTESGIYKLNLSSSVYENNLTISEDIYVGEEEFVIERISATRIYPPLFYPMKMKITANRDFTGTVTEKIPATFELKETDALVTRTDNEILLTWDVDWEQGNTYEIEYEYKAPNISPEFYLMGSLSIGEFSEQRKWQIAADAVNAHVGFFSPPATMTTGLNTDVVLSQPDPRQNDLMLATIAVRPSTATVATPSGWTLLSERTGTDGGAEGENTGSVRFYWFYKKATGSEGKTTVTFTKTGTISVWMGQIMQTRSATGEYDVVEDGYSLNGDVTNWNGTLSSPSFTLQNGDLVLIAGAQNGNLAGAGSYNITATNLVSKSTVNEHGEFATTSGNNVEIDLAATQIWEANTTTSHSITFTLSTSAASGAVSVIRVRQGAGTNRTDTWVRAAGRQVVGTTSVAVSYPEHDYGDLLIYLVGSRISTDAVPTTPTGWTYLDSYSGGAGSFAADSGVARITAFYREATSRYTGTQTVSLASGNSMIGQIVSIHRDNTASWSFDTDGGGDNTAGTDWSVTGSGIDLSSANGGDLVLMGTSINTDQVTGYNSHALSASGITFGDVTQTGEFTTTSGNDMAIDVTTGRVASGTATGVAPTFTMTAPSTSGNYPAGSSIFIKVVGNGITEMSNTVGFFSPEAVWTSTATSTLSLRQPDPRQNDLLVASIAVRPSTALVDTPSGWTSLGSWTGTDGGAEGADTGSVRIYWFYKVATGSEGTTNQAFTLTDPTNFPASVWNGTVMQLRSATGTYSLSAGGYSRNTDSTNWNGTLDTDLGLTQGDVVLMAAAQNGDLAAVSAWELVTSGITSQGTVVRHGEYTSTTGNDIEIDLASVHIWEGNGTSASDVQFTTSVAASGAMSAIRVRQGSGTARSDTFIRAAGKQTAGSTSVAVNYPEHDVGDLLVLFVGNRASGDPSPENPDGWTSLGTYVGGAGTFGADAGNARITAWYRVAGERSMGTMTIPVTGGSSTVGQMVSLYREDSLSWTLDSDGGADNTGNTTWSVTGSGIDLSSTSGGTVVLAGSSINTDARLFSAHNMAATGITFNDVTQVTEFRTSTGNDMTLELASGRVIGGTDTQPITFTSTANGSTASNPTGGTLFISATGVVNDPPSLTVSQPDGTGDTVTVGDSYNITYTLTDSEDTVTAAMYYDSDDSGLDGTPITGSCASASEGTDVTCSWNTTGMTPGSYYVYGIANDGTNPDVSDYSPGQITIQAAGATLSGVIYTDEGSSPYLCSTSGNLTVNLRVNGSGSYTGNCTADTGAWSISGISVSSGDTITAYLSGGSVRSSSVVVSDGTEESNINLFQGKVIVRDDLNGSITNSEIHAGQDSGTTDDLITTTASTLTVSSTYEIHLWSGDTYAPGGDVSSGKLHIPSGSTYTGSTETLTLTGSGTGTSRPLYVSSGTFTAPETTVFSGSGNTEIESVNYNNLILNKSTSNTVLTLTSSTTISETLTITSGILTQGTSNLIIQGSPAVSIGSDGTWENISTGDISLGGSLTNSGVLTFISNNTCGGSDDIAIASLSGTPTWSGGGTFELRDVNIANQNASVNINLYSSTNSGGNTGSWNFYPGCDNGNLTTDIVDDNGDSVSSPTVSFPNQSFSYSYQNSSGTFGISTEKMRVSNTTANSLWALTLAASSGSTAVWSTGSNYYDFNDPSSNATDGTDSDGYGGQMSVNPTVSTITPQVSCSSTGISKGSSSSFNEEAALNSITLLSAGGSAAVGCYWDLTGVDIDQSIPALQPSSGYSISMTLTVVAQ